MHVREGVNFAKPSMLVHLQPEYNAADVIVMTLIRCVALLYSYHQFRTLSKMGSKYILGKCFARRNCDALYICTTRVAPLHTPLGDAAVAFLFYALVLRKFACGSNGFLWPAATSIYEDLSTFGYLWLVPVRDERTAIFRQPWKLIGNWAEINILSGFESVYSQSANCWVLHF